MTRLWWDGRRGGADVDGKHQALTLQPGIDIIVRWTEIDYAPDVRVAIIRPMHGAMRDMSSQEVAACRRFLGLEA